MFNQEILFTKEECRDIINMNNGFTRSKVLSVYGYNLSSRRTGYYSLVETTDEIKNLLLPKLSKYGVIGLATNFTILRYEKGQEFKKHRDSGVHENIKKRYKTLIIQLSNFDDYDGGELVVWDNNDETETICDKDIGNMILFPSKLLHQAKPVTSGTRYAMTFFLTDDHFNIKNTLI
jgi:hypothetical protein